MGTAVFLHAHPDDEVIISGGSMARAADEGHRVVLVVATNGDHGEAPDDLVGSESVVDRRRDEVRRSAAILGVDRIEWLGYRDSGMTGWAENDHPECLWQADVDDAGTKLAALLTEEDADLLVVYDWHGVYGHPDHVQVHRVGRRAAELAGTPHVFEATMNRDAMVAGVEDAPGEMEFDPNEPADDGNPFGTPEAELHLAVDVSAYVGKKREAIACHASQTTDVGMFLAMPDEMFTLAFSTEWFIRPGAAPGLRTGWLFDGIADEPNRR